MPARETTLEQALPWLRKQAGCAGADADDLVQEVCLAAWTSSLAEGPGFKSWLRKTLLNRRRMTRRSDLRRQRREFEASLATPAGGDATVEAALAHAELERIVTEELQALREPLCSALVQRFFAGHSATEIAARTGITPSAVRSRIAAGVSELRARLEARTGFNPNNWSLSVAVAPGARWLPNWKIQLMTTVKKIAYVTIVGAAVVATGVAVVRTRDSEPAPAMIAKTGSQKPALVRPKTTRSTPRLKRPSLAYTDGSDRIGEIRRARERRLEGEQRATDRAPDSPPASASGELAWLSGRSGLAEGEAEDYELLVREIDESLDTCLEVNGVEEALPIDYRFEVVALGEPDVGAVVESVTMTRNGTPAPAVGECLQESLYTLSLDPPQTGLQKTMTFNIRRDS